MTSVYTNVLSNEELQYLNALPKVLTAKAKLDAQISGMVYFSVAVTDSIRTALQSQFGLNLSTGSSIPMRWIKGDTAPHVDVGSSNFENTYLVYLNDSPGEFIINSQSYSIQANSGFVFNEGILHETLSTENVPRLLIGPMNEFAQPVGGAIVCFLEGSTILCEVNGVEKYIPVEELKKGTLVKTSLNGSKPVVLVGKRNIYNVGNDERTESRLYKCSPSNYPQLKNDLYITGGHSILEFPITDKQKDAIIKYQGKLYVTDRKYRLMACLDERAEPWNSEGEYTIWHFALENDDKEMNYGVYANGGLLVETCSINTMKNKSGMTLIE
jgi:hypothetical protein